MWDKPAAPQVKQSSLQDQQQTRLVPSRGPNKPTAAHLARVQVSLILQLVDPYGGSWVGWAAVRGAVQDGVR